MDIRKVSRCTLHAGEAKGAEAGWVMVEGGGASATDLGYRVIFESIRSDDPLREA
jgi:hypothetical protein